MDREGKSVREHKPILTRVLPLMMAIGLLLAFASSVFSLMNPVGAESIIFHAAILGCMQRDNSVGVASMEEDGTIVLQLRAEGPGGIFGDALLRYPPGHPDYEMILDHMGGLTRGEAKEVPPWPGE